jgi:hypothetical protein
LRKEITILHPFHSIKTGFHSIKATGGFLLLLFYGNLSAAQNNTEISKEFPVPAGNANQLFYLQRTENTNTIIYEINEENGQLNTENPIRIFWILYTKQEQHEDLSDMEKKFAYGIKIHSTGNSQYQFILVACPKITLELKKDVRQKYQVYVTPSKQQIILQKVYIKEKKERFKLEPSVEYIEFTGKDVLSGKDVIEKIVP